MAKSSFVDLLLVNPGGRARVFQSLANELTAIEPPVWAGLMAEFAKTKGLSVDILDANALELDATEAASLINDINPVLTAVVIYGHQPSASTQNMPFAGDICSELNKINPSLKTLMTGGHVAALPERTLREEDVHFVASGEGLQTMVDLVRILKGGSQKYENIPGLWYWDGDIVRSNPSPALVTDLDHEVPGIAWELLPMERYRAHNWHCFGDLKRQPYAAIYTTLGCPYHCSFCCIQAPFKSGESVLGMNESVNSYRFWSPNIVGSQIDILVNQYGVKNLKISDEMFVLNKRHVHGICDLISERGYDLNIWAYARVDTINDVETIYKLKEAGFNWLCLGIESGSERVLENVSKSYSQEIIGETIERVRGAGINVLANFIFGLPEDSLSSMQETLDLAMELNCEFANFYSSMAYPGSRLYELALQNQWPLPEEWTGYSQHSSDTLPLPTNYLTGLDVLKFRDKAFNAYFTNAKYLDMVSKRFGPATANQIMEMATLTLDRRR